MVTLAWRLVAKPSYSHQGSWYDYISCDSACGSGTSPPQSSGPIKFDFTLACSAALTPSSFVTNNNGYLFASDIGIPNGSGGYFTGDVVTAGPLTPVPLPASAWLLLTGLAAIGVTRYSMARRLDRSLSRGCTPASPQACNREGR